MHDPFYPTGTWHSQRGIAEGTGASGVRSEVPSVAAITTDYRHNVTKPCASCSFLDISTPIQLDGLFCCFVFFRLVEIFYLFIFLFFFIEFFTLETVLAFVSLINFNECANSRDTETR